MGKLSDILELAHSRNRSLGADYAGSLTPQEAMEVWQLAPGARLVDVRTRAEWNWVGRVPNAVEIEWQGYPGFALNPHFIAELKHRISHESLVMFICRSGVRSHNAACLATEAGFSACYNVLEGFEGNVDASGQRGKLGGWRFAGLPWHS